MKSSPLKKRYDIFFCAKSDAQISGFTLVKKAASP